jgi:Ribbon-helix-helix protein, copG family
MRQRLNIYLPPELIQQVDDLAGRKRLSKSAIVEAAIACFLSPDGAERREAAFVRRLDLMTRQLKRLERNTSVMMEMLAVFMRFSLTMTPPLPPDALAAAQAKGHQRYQTLIEALGQRLKDGQSFLDEIPDDVEPAGHGRSIYEDFDPQGN